MMMMPDRIEGESYTGIYLFNESPLSLPLDESILSKIRSLIAENESCQFKWVEVAFVDEETIVQINKQHLGRDYVTDIITFRYDENTSNNAIEGTLYCCAPRIQEQAVELEQAPEREFRRIIIHGLLHLAGYDDQTPAEKEVMTRKENFYLEKL